MSALQNVLANVGLLKKPLIDNGYISALEVSIRRWFLNASQVN